MEEFLELLKDHSGAITALATVVLTATTIVYAALTAVLARENRLLRRAGTEPEVVAYLIPDQRNINMINLIVANVGRGPAMNVAIEYVADFDDFAKHGVRASFKGRRKLLSALPQGERFHFLFGSAFDLLGQNPLKDFSIKVFFEDTHGRERTSESLGSISNFEGIGRAHTPENEIAEAVKKISEAIQSRQP